MTKCLLGLGSNMGDREVSLRKAIAEIDALPDVQILKQSEFHRSKPVGGPPDQEEFLNAAALFETRVPSFRLLSDLQQIETRHGRERSERWAPRPLDVDVLLYGNEVAETETLILPHPRMSFRRFVLEPCVKIAPRILHPTIGWPIERLLLHLSAASNLLAIMSPAEDVRTRVANAVVQRFGVPVGKGPQISTVSQQWPPALTTWIDMPQPTDGGDLANVQSGVIPYAAATFPKLSIVIDAQAEGVVKAQWSSVVRRPGRGPTLRLQTSDEALINAEVFAAVDSVWPDLGPASVNRLK